MYAISRCHVLLCAETALSSLLLPEVHRYYHGHDQIWYPSPHKAHLITLPNASLIDSSGQIPAPSVQIRTVRPVQPGTVLIITRI